MKITHVMALVVLAVCVAGCDLSNQLPTNKPAMLVDLDAVAKALGQDEVIQQKITAAEQELQVQLKNILAELQGKVKIAQDSLTAKSSAEDKERVAQLTVQAQQTLRNEQAAAQQRVNQVRLELVNKFRDEIKAVAEPIARALGVKKVETISSAILWFDPEIDITDEVIAKLRARQ